MDHHQFPFDLEQQNHVNFDQFLRDADAKLRRFFNFIRSIEFCAGVCLLLFLSFRYPWAFRFARRVVGLVSTPLFLIGLFYAILAIMVMKSHRNPAEIVGARFFEEMVTPFQAGREPVNEEAEAGHYQLFTQPLSGEIGEAEVEHNEQHAQPLSEDQEEEVYYEDKEIIFEECSSFPTSTWDTTDKEETDLGWGQTEEPDNEEEVEVQPLETTEMQNSMDFVDYILQNMHRADELSNEDFNETMFAYIARCWKVIRQPAPPDDDDDDQVEIEEIRYFEEFYLYGRA